MHTPRPSSGTASPPAPGPPDGRPAAGQDAAEALPGPCGVPRHRQSRPGSRVAESPAAAATVEAAASQAAREGENPGALGTAPGGESVR